MEEIVAIVLSAFGEICCQVFAAFGADLVAAFAAFMLRKEESPNRRGWKYFFWSVLPIAICLTVLAVIALLAAK